MDLADEDISFEPVKKDRSAKRGRRAKKEEATFDVDQSVDGLPEDIATTSTKPARDKDAPPRPSRRTGGWGEEKRRTMEELDDLDKTIEDGEKIAEFDGRRRGTAVRPAFGFDDEDADDAGDNGDRLQQRRPSEDSDDDIPVIPELEDHVEEDLTAQVAVAPNVVVNRVATYRELDNELLRHAQFLTLDNEIDLKLLAKCLSSDQDLAEEDSAWEWDRLFTEVTSELLTEWEKDQVTEEEEATA